MLPAAAGRAAADAGWLARCAPQGGVPCSVCWCGLVAWQQDLLPQLVLVWHHISWNFKT